ncbi:MAG: ParB family chromosome partitioning protein [Candidatus Omnitrophota bacterium]|jgi:ParB family chromosome partitioning protein
MVAKKKGGLGRGLNALMNDAPRGGKIPGEPVPSALGVTEIAITDIVANPWQPRQEFDADALQELTESIREMGVLQPLLVRKHEKVYQLIAGERRFRASEAAGLKKVPVIVRDITDQEALEIALVENLQRRDLDIIEEAEGYQRLSDEFSMTQEQIAKRVGKARATVANALRLLNLSPIVREEVRQGHVSAGHAKALLGLAKVQDQVALARRIAAEGLSVRETERLVSEAKPKSAAKKASTTPQREADPHLRDVAEMLQRKLGTGVRISSPSVQSDGKKNPGKISIEYYSNDDLNRVLDVIGLEEDI